MISFDNNNNFLISQQLLQLLKWLSEHEKDQLQRMVTRSIKQGLQEQLYLDESISDYELQEAMSEFLMMLESHLYDALHNTKQFDSLIPSVDRIDSAACDDSVVAKSIANASDALIANPYADPKELLCKALIKQWKPAGKQSVH